MTDDFKPGDLLRRDGERLRRYRDLLDIYRGAQWQGRERPGEKHLTFNYARVIIDKLTTYLMAGVKIVVDPAEDSPPAKETARRAEKALQQVYEENGLEQLDFETEADCAVLGDACYKVVWDAEESRVRVTAPDVQGIHVWTRADDVGGVWRVASRYSMESDSARALYGVKSKGRTATVVELWTAQDFALWVDDVRIEQKDNPFGFIPFIIFPKVLRLRVSNRGIPK